MAKEYSYGTCIYYKNELDNSVSILLIQPKGHKEWGFPKGKIESNETKEQCAIRETFEEIGIKIKEELLEKYFEQTNKRKDIGIFLVNMNNLDLNSKFKINPREVHKVKLLNVNDINVNNINVNDKFDIYKNQSSILNNIINYLNRG